MGRKFKSGLISGGPIRPVCMKKTAGFRMGSGVDMVSESVQPYPDWDQTAFN
jgi:hypothetical protein